LDQHPDLRLQVRVVNTPVDPVGAGFDIVLHVGPLKDSRLVARPLLKASWALAAAPSYLARHGNPRRVADLANHACLRLAGDLPQDEGQLVDKAGKIEVISVTGPSRPTTAECLAMPPTPAWALACAQSENVTLLRIASRRYGPRQPTSDG
jgi:DNA-binding transcriptional LysR family regulator